MGMHVLEALASSANCCAFSSRIKSAVKGISVFHSLVPPISFSPALRALLSLEEIAKALVAAINIAIELFLGI